MLGESPCKAYTYYGTHIELYAYTHIKCIHDVDYDISHDTVGIPYNPYIQRTGHYSGWLDISTFAFACEYNTYNMRIVYHRPK